MESRARIALSHVRTFRFRLIFHPWGREAGSEPVKALFLVSLELYGIPDHAWHRAAAGTLLAPFCKVEHLAPETRNLADMSVFRLSAWTINPDAISRSSELLLPGDDAVEHDADPDRAKRLARFPVRIHVASWVNYRRPPPPPSVCFHAFPSADRVSARLRLGALPLLTDVGPRDAPDAPSPALEASPSDLVQTPGSHVSRDACISNRPIGTAPSSPSPVGPSQAILISQPGVDTTPPHDDGPVSRLPLGDIGGPIRVVPPSFKASRGLSADVTDAGDSSAANLMSPHPLSPRSPDPEPTKDPPRLAAASHDAPSNCLDRADPEPMAGPSCLDVVRHVAPTGPMDDRSAPSLIQPMQTTDVPAPDVALSSFVDAISARASSLLQAQKPRRHRKELPANFTPRRSFRIARADQGLNSEMKAKRVLLRRVGLISSDDAPISDEVLYKYALLFEQPLALDVLQAFADFFGWQLPSSLPPTLG
ncbi:hypothetical protein VPH35_053463 [Triticum aestivum]|uniref:DUF4283 domain-containing protein n=1 Tax=Triticum aestivum TaxID=4565 RepID=A0A077S4E5_WHEAT|nr:unnamed protein product [Triticum aestivum]